MYKPAEKQPSYEQMHMHKRGEIIMKKQEYDESVEQEFSENINTLVEKYHEKGIDLESIEINQWKESRYVFRFNKNHQIYPALQKKGSERIGRLRDFNTPHFEKILKEREQKKSVVEDAMATAKSKGYIIKHHSGGGDGNVKNILTINI
jgi:hypothetical protein